MDSLYSVGQLADDFGVTPRALRFYEDKGLIAPRRIGSRRIYSHRDHSRLQLILRGKRLGFSLREIREWLDLYDSDANQAAQTQHLIERVHGRIEDLERRQRDLEKTLYELRAIEQDAKAHLKSVEQAPAKKRKRSPASKEA